MGAGERSDLKYRRVPPVPLAPESSGVRRRRSRGHPASVPNSERARRLDVSLGDFGVLKPENENKQSQSALEKEFDAFFGNMVSEWNPCYSDGGQWRYKWDEEIGAYDVDVELPADATSEQKAVHMVSGRAPDRMNLRRLLDRIFAEEQGAGQRSVDVQPVRRLVAALVNRVARHTKHGMEAPKLGVHACARGKEGCPFCRYGFPRDRLARGGARPMVMEKGDREGQWHARFPRNDLIVCAAVMKRTCSWRIWGTLTGALS